MIPLEIYLLRHGQTDYNLNNIVQGGGIDSDLNELGKEQGRKFYKRYQDIPFEGLYSSGLKRSFQTIQFFENSSNSIQQMPEFNEMNWGDFEGRKGTERLQNHFMELNAEWDSGNLFASARGGENPLEAWERAEKGIVKLRGMHPEGGKVLLCTHGRVLKIMLSELLGFGLKNMNHFAHHNTGLNIIHLNGAGPAFAEILNDLSHLE